MNPTFQPADISGLVGAVRKVKKNGVHPEPVDMDLRCNKNNMIAEFKITPRDFSGGLKFAYELHEAIVRFSKAFAKQNRQHRSGLFLFDPSTMVLPQGSQGYAVNLDKLKHARNSYKYMLANFGWVLKYRAAKPDVQGKAQQKGPTPLAVQCDMQSPFMNWAIAEPFNLILSIPDPTNSRNSLQGNLLRLLKTVLRMNGLQENTHLEQGIFTILTGELLLLLAIKVRNRTVDYEARENEIKGWTGKGRGVQKKLALAELSKAKKVATTLMARYFSLESDRVAFPNPKMKGVRTWGNTGQKVSIIQVLNALRGTKGEEVTVNNLCTVANFKSIVNAVHIHRQKTVSVESGKPQYDTNSVEYRYLNNVDDLAVQLNFEYEILRAIYTYNFPEAASNAKTASLIPIVIRSSRSPCPAKGEKIQKTPHQTIFQLLDIQQ